MKPWTAARKAKFSATMAAKKPPVTKGCQTCPSLLTNVDLSNGCVRCVKCRKGGFNLPLSKLSHQEPANLESWWTRNQQREQIGAWFDEAKAQTGRMAKSKEAKSLGFRRSVDELGGKRRSVGES